MRGLILLLMLGLGVLLFAKKDFDALKNFGHIEQTIKQTSQVFKPNMRHIKEKKQAKNDETFHQIPPGCKDLESRTITPLSAKCK